METGIYVTEYGVVPITDEEIRILDLARTEGCLASADLPRVLRVMADFIVRQCNRKAKAALEQGPPFFWLGVAALENNQA